MRVRWASSARRTWSPRPYTTPPGYPRKFARLSTHGLYLQEFNSATPESRSVAYDECIGYVDDQIKALLDELKRRGLDKRTLLVITSDHGDMLWSQDQQRKQRPKLR